MTKEKQKEIESRWRKILLESPTFENYQAAYDELHQYLLSQRPLLYEEMNLIKTSVLKLIGSGKKVLDLGCGDGLFSKEIAKLNNEVYGIDVSPLAIEKAKQQENPKLKLHFQIQDIFKLEFKDNFFDTVIGLDLIEHLHPNQVKNHLKEVFRVLKPQGFYLIWTPPKSLGPTSLGLHLKEYFPKEIGDLLRSFEFKVTLYEARFMLWGPVFSFLPFSLSFIVDLWEKFIYYSRLYKILTRNKILKNIFIPIYVIKAQKPKFK